mmetsp:Transcript_9281/g.23251  ORF Transcript_9281/g.23251 Transcript_9281/m.23251 type:complete len:210 (-) Transcript_9281:748-1377(-)
MLLYHQGNAGVPLRQLDHRLLYQLLRRARGHGQVFGEPPDRFQAVCVEFRAVHLLHVVFGVVAQRRQPCQDHPHNIKAGFLLVFELIHNPLQVADLRGREARLNWVEVYPMANVVPQSLPYVKNIDSIEGLFGEVVVVGLAGDQRLHDKHVLLVGLWIRELVHHPSVRQERICHAGDGVGEDRVTNEANEVARLHRPDPLVNVVKVALV